MLPQPIPPSVRFQSTSYGNLNQVHQEELGAAQKLLRNMLYSWTVVPEDVPQNARNSNTRDFSPYASSYGRNTWIA